jgi:23S rRNA (uracil1939-C5)-methyltransferase
MPHQDTRLDVKIEKLVYGGDGLSRQDGKVVFTPYVLPGERVATEVIREKPGLVWTRPADVVEPAADRVAAPCPYFTRCGGCHYQHAPYEYQLRAKRDILVEELRRLGKIEYPGEIDVVAGEPWNYRNRAQFHVRGNRIGYLEARSHLLCPVETCPISSPKINTALATLTEMARDRRWPGFVRSIEVFTNETEVQLNVLESERPVARRFFEWCAERIPELVSGALDYPLEGVIYRVSAGSFFQVNRFLAGKLVETALAGAEGGRALDLYAGVGLFSIPLARRFGEVTAVESGAAAARDLRFNAERAEVQVSCLQTSAAEYLAQIGERPDFALLDPPRAGLGKEVVGRLLGLAVPHLVIVSCDPATLARDLPLLVGGGYQIETITLIDLFPQTYHLETVCRLRYAGKAD